MVKNYTFIELLFIGISLKHVICFLYTFNRPSYISFCFILSLFKKYRYHFYLMILNKMQYKRNYNEEGGFF